MGDIEFNSPPTFNDGVNEFMEQLKQDISKSTKPPKVYTYGGGQIYAHSNSIVDVLRRLDENEGED